MDKNENNVKSGNAEMKVCKSCGYANDPDSKYCIKCGEKI
jgi:uncharacterized OB-fold protein